MGARYGLQARRTEFAARTRLWNTSRTLGEIQYTNAHVALHQRHAGCARMDADLINFSDLNARLAFIEQALNP